jgi:hypothetical protein
MRDDFVAAYLIEDNGCVAFVDTGCYLSVPTLLATLDEKNIKLNKQQQNHHAYAVCQCK